MILIKHPKYLTQLIIILSNAKYKHTKVVPVVSIDVNNLPTAKLSDESIDFIFHDINPPYLNYSIVSRKKLLFDSSI